MYNSSITPWQEVDSGCVVYRVEGSKERATFTGSKRIPKEDIFKITNVPKTPLDVSINHKVTKLL